MDRSEPALIPEWLKSSGSATSGGYGNHQSASCLRSDDHSVSKHTRNKSALNNSEHELGRTSLSDRTTSSYFRRSSSTKDPAHLRSYSSFNRSHRDRSWEDFHDFTDKDKSILGERHREYSDHLGGTLSGKFSKDPLRRSQSLVSRKQDSTSSRKVSGDSSDASKSNHINSSSLLLASGSVQSSMQTAFGRDFPTLGTEQKPGSSELRRVPSPVLSAPLQGLSTASSNVIGVDGWTSSLAEVPGLIGSSSAGGLLPQQTVSGMSAPLGQRAGGPNMAEKVAQGPSRARTPPQVSVDTQRLEELAIRQSRQLIPVTPSMPKPASLGPSEKLKLKTGQQQPQILSSNHGNQSQRGGPARLDAGKTSNLGKLQVLKPSRESNGVSANVKESLSPRNGVKVVHSPLSQTPSTAAPASNRSPVKTQNSIVSERKAVVSSTSLEKRPSLQVQSRNDFFNLLKKKSAASNLPGTSTEPSASEKSNGEAPAGPDASVSQDGPSLDSSVENGGKPMMMNNGDGCGPHFFVDNGEELSDVDVPYPSEEEAAFLRSLGWDDCDGDGGGLTEEEIKAFYECAKMRLGTGFQLKVNNRNCIGSTSSGPELV